jgi:hypothetical protein
MKQPAGEGLGGGIFNADGVGWLGNLSRRRHTIRHNPADEAGEYFQGIFGELT